MSVLLCSEILIAIYRFLPLLQNRLYMAKLYINKDIVADKDKMENWYLTGEEGLSFPDIQNFLSWIDPNDHVIDIEIHSCGGDAVEGYAIYDALRASGKQISCTAVGRCASMATVILLAAAKERRFAYPHAKFLIHKPYMASYDGDLDLETLESIKSNLESEKNKMLALYVERTGSEASVIEAQMNKAGRAWSYTCDHRICGQLARGIFFFDIGHG